MSQDLETTTKKNFAISEVDFILLVSIGIGVFVIIFLVLLILLVVECNRRKRLQKLLKQKQNTDFESSALKLQPIEQERTQKFISISETNSRSQNQEYVKKTYEQNNSDAEDEIGLDEEIRL